MLLTALTGGIASGKSTVSRVLSGLGAVHVDADRVAREVVEAGTPALEHIGEAFGPAVIAPDGSLDRRALASLVFGDAERLAVLNGIVHPAVRERSAQLFRQAEDAAPHAIVVYDVPLLVESPSPHAFDVVIVVHAPAAVRRERLIRLRGMSEEEADRRIASQATDEERLAVADLVVDATGNVEDTRRAAEDVWRKLVAREGRAAG